MDHPDDVALVADLDAANEKLSELAQQFYKRTGYCFYDVSKDTSNLLLILRMKRKRREALAGLTPDQREALGL